MSAAPCWSEGQLCCSLFGNRSLHLHSREAAAPRRISPVPERLGASDHRHHGAVNKWPAWRLHPTESPAGGASAAALALLPGGSGCLTLLWHRRRGSRLSLESSDVAAQPRVLGQVLHFPRRARSATPTTFQVMHPISHAQFTHVDAERRREREGEGGRSGAFLVQVVHSDVC